MDPLYMPTTATLSSCSVWRVWNGGTFAITVGANDPWPLWTGTSATTSATTGTIWTHWIGAYGGNRQPVTGGFYAVPTQTEAQRALAAEQAREANAKRERARARAYALLDTFLSDEQRHELADKGHFHVDAPSGRRYRIDRGSHGNVKVIDRVTGVWSESLCVQPSGVPDGDAMLMQKLLIETAEEQFRATANITDRNGNLVGSSKGPLTGDKLAEVIPFRRRVLEALRNVA